MVIDDKGGEISTKIEEISEKGRKILIHGEKYDKGKGSIKTLSTQVGEQAHELVWCI